MISNIPSSLITPSKGRGFALLEVIIAVSIMGLVLAGSAKIAMDKMAKTELAKVGEQVAALIIAVDKRVYLDNVAWQNTIHIRDNFAWLKHETCDQTKGLGLPAKGELNSVDWPEAPLLCGFKSYFGRGYDAYTAEQTSGTSGKNTFHIELDAQRNMRLNIRLKRPTLPSDSYMMEAGRIRIGIEDALRSHGFYLENISLEVGPVGSAEIKKFLADKSLPLEVKIRLKASRYLETDGSVAMEPDSKFCWKDGATRSCMTFADKTLNLVSGDGKKTLDLKAKSVFSNEGNGKFYSVPKVTEVIGGDLILKPQCPTGYQAKISLMPSTVSDRDQSGIDWGDNDNRDPAIQKATLTAGWTLGWASVTDQNKKPAWKTIISIGSKEFKDGLDNPKGFRAVALTWCEQIANP